MQNQNKSGREFPVRVVSWADFKYDVGQNPAKQPEPVQVRFRWWNRILGCVKAVGADGSVVVYVWERA